MKRPVLLSSGQPFTATSAHRSDDDNDQASISDDMMGLMTPVLKGVLTDTGFANAVNAQQMYGGHGYIS